MKKKDLVPGGPGRPGKVPGHDRTGPRDPEGPGTKEVQKSRDFFFEGPGTPWPLLHDRILLIRFKTEVQN